MALVQRRLSVSNLMGMTKYKELKAQGLNVRLENCQKRLYAYGGKELNEVGQIRVQLSVGTKKVNSQFVVTMSGRCLLGHITSRDLGLLCISLGASNELAECNVVSEDLASALQTKYPKVFNGIGKLKDYRLKLHVDPEVTPVAQKPRRVPFPLREKKDYRLKLHVDPEVTPVAQKPRRVRFPLREKVAAKVEDLIAKDIVERVDGPTSWVSPVVVAPKSEGDIRLCVDMRKPNQAIICKRIPIPTV